MGDSWVPQSAAALASGAVALVLGALMLPSTPDSGQIVATVQQEGSRWLMATVAFFIASVALTLGLPAVLFLAQHRGRRTMALGVVVFSVGTIGTAGYAALLVFFRALVVDEAISATDVDGLAGDPGMAAFLGTFVVAFYVGELLIAIGLLRSGAVPRWVPALLVAHVASLVLQGIVPDAAQPFLTVLIGVALMGVAIAANDAATAGSAVVRRPVAR